MRNAFPLHSIPQTEINGVKSGAGARRKLQFYELLNVNQSEV